MLATSGRPSPVSAAVAAAAPPAVDRFPEMQALVAERRSDRPVQPMSGTDLIGAVVHVLATAIEEGWDLS
jgi:hypothetical protein